MDKRRCLCCKNNLPVEAFEDTESKQYKNCANCRRKSKEYYQKHKKEISEKGKEYRKNNKEETSKRKREEYKKNKDKRAAQKKIYYNKNREKILEQKRKYNKENKEKISKRRKEYYNKNREKILERDREYNRQNKEKRAEKDRKYRNNNKEKIQQRQKNYYLKNREKFLTKSKIYYSTPQGRAVRINSCIRRRGYIGENGITKEDWLAIMWLNSWKCFYCDTDLTIDNRTIDHLIPLCQGGKHEVDNLLPSCKDCNFNKQDKLVKAWYKFGSLSLEKQAVILSMLAKYK